MLQKYSENTKQNGKLAWENLVPSIMSAQILQGSTEHVCECSIIHYSNLGSTGLVAQKCRSSPC